MIAFSEANIKAQQTGAAITLRDPGYKALRFRFHQSRVSGSWFVVRSDVWYFLGHWPLLTVKAVKKVLPEKLAALAINKSVSLRETFDTVADVLGWYTTRISKDAHRSRERKASIQSAIKCHLLPRLGALPLKGLTRQALDDMLIWPLQETHSLATVKAVLSVLKQAFKQADKVGRLDVNPLAGVVFTDFIAVPLKEKDGRLLATDIETVFNGLLDCDRVTQCLVVMLLGHGTRITETLAAKWSNIDLVDGYWRLPMADTKTSEWHKLPLTVAMTAFLTAYRDTQKRKGYRGVFVFPGHGHAKPLSYSSARKLIQKVSVSQWSAHDCRKALKTICTEALSINDAVSERILNHAMDRTRKAYDQALYDVPMLNALTTYHTWLDTRGFERLRAETETRSSRSIEHNNTSARAA
ncbi:hypothetical protein BCT27_12585 [Enterovibrio norvegicus]|nr:hypothetical protein BCT27_12585 [Enterovibrio norvegicus]